MENNSMIQSGEGLEQPASPSPIRWEKKDTGFLCAAGLAAGYYFFAHFPYVFSDSYHLPGFGWTLTQWLLTIAALLSAWRSGRLKARGRAGGWFLLIMALGLGLSFSLYADDGLRAMNMPVDFALTVLALLSVTGVNPLPALSGKGLTLGLYRFLPACFRHAARPFQALGRIQHKKPGRFRGLAAGLLLGLPVAAVALALLNSADAIFSSVLERGFHSVTNINGAFFFRLLLTALFSLPLYSLLRAGEEEPWASAPGMERRANPVTLSTVLVMLTAVYGMFVYVQFRYLFGGAEAVLTAGGYAQYARSGFFQLVILAMLTLLLIFPFLHLCSRSRAVRFLCGLTAALTMVIDFSAFYRMRMYIEAFGLSVLRVVTLWGMAMIFLALTACLLKCAAPKVRVCPALTVLALTTWLGLNLCGVDRLVAADLVARYNSGAVPKLDVEYLAGLSPDILPELAHIEDTEARQKAQRQAAEIFFAHRPVFYDSSLSWSLHSLDIPNEGEGNTL